MATNYPGAIDALTNPTAGDALTSPSHAAQHANANDAIEAVQAELGTLPKGSAASVKARLEGVENGSRLTLTSLLTTKGDLVARDASTAVRLPVGADGTVLQADAGSAAGVRWGTPTTRVGSGSPLNIVVPDFKGQEFVDTAQTLGARKWVATSTLASGWVVSDGETPPYLVKGLLINGWQGGNGLFLRRIGRQVELIAHSAPGYALDGSAATNSRFMLLPPGFGLDNARVGNYGYIGSFTSSGADVFADGGASLLAMAGRSNIIFGTLRWTTPDPWPTSAPV